MKINKFNLEDIPSNVYICYVDNKPPHDYFINNLYENTNNRYKDLYIFVTNLDKNEIWGDDWDDAPYEYNASEPYARDNNRMWVIKIEDFYTLESDEDEFWRIQKDNWFLLKDKYPGVQASVAEINQGIFPWLFTENSYKKIDGKVINVNTSIKELIQYFKNYNLTVYTWNRD